MVFIFDLSPNFDIFSLNLYFLGKCDNLNVKAGEEWKTANKQTRARRSNTLSFVNINNHKTNIEKLALMPSKQIFNLVEIKQLSTSEDN